MVVSLLTLSVGAFCSWAITHWYHQKGISNQDILKLHIFAARVQDNLSYAKDQVVEKLLEEKSDYFASNVPLSVDEEGVTEDGNFDELIREKIRNSLILDPDFDYILLHCPSRTCETGQFLYKEIKFQDAEGYRNGCGYKLGCRKCDFEVSIPGFLDVSQFHPDDVDLIALIRKENARNKGLKTMEEQKINIYEDNQYHNFFFNKWGMGFDI